MTVYHVVAVVILALAVAIPRHPSLIFVYHALGAVFFTRAAYAAREPRWLPVVLILAAVAMWTVGSTEAR